MTKEERARIAVDYLNENGCIPVSIEKLETVRDAAAVAQIWLDAMREHTDCCGTAQMRPLLSAISEIKV